MGAKGLDGARATSIAVAISVAVSAVLPIADATAWSPIDPSRPVWADTVPYRLSEPSADLGATTTEAEVQRGMTDWTSVACADLDASYGGRTTTSPLLHDGESVIGWVESDWPHESSVIGATAPRYWTISLVESDMAMNGVHFTWVTDAGGGGRVNAYSIILHEAGHYYGLGHTTDSSAVMTPTYTGGIVSLGDDDRAGICALYPGPGTDCTTVGCPAGHTCVERTCERVPGTGEVCARCTTGAECASGTCLGYLDRGAYCSRSCTDASDCDGIDQCVEVPELGGQCVRIRDGTPSCDGPATCASDAECPRTEQCVDADCVARPTVGAPLGEVCNGPSDCSSAMCFRNECTEACEWTDPGSCPDGFYCSGEVTGSCAGSGLCVRGSAGSAELGGPCTAATDCASLHCASGVCSEPCVPGEGGCSAGSSCRVGAVLGCGSCVPAGALGEPCEIDDDCVSGTCAMIEGAAFCTELCGAGDPCPTGFGCRDGGGMSVCAPDAAPFGGDCATDDDCASALCLAGAERRYCTLRCDPGAACPAGYACGARSDGALRVCMPIGTPSAVSGGCGCRAGGGRGRGAILVAAAMLALAVIRRRR